MKKMSFKCIFNWLYAKTLDRAMTERRPREDREMNHSVYRPVRVSYLSRISLVALLLLVLGGWNSEVFAAWSESGSAVKKVGSTYYVVYDTDEYELSKGKTNDHALSGPGAELTFEAKRNRAGTGNLLVTQNSGTSKLYEGNPGRVTGYSWGVELVDFQNYGSYGVDVNTTKITFKNDASISANTQKHIRNVKVTMAQYLNNPTKTDLDCGTADINSESTSGQVNVAWCNVPAMSYEITDDAEGLFSVSVDVNSEAGKYNTSHFTVTYKHTKAGTHTAKLKITDTYNSYSKTVNLSGTTNKQQPTITWSPDEAYFNVDDVLSATSAPGTTVTLSGNSTYVGCEGNKATMLAATTEKITITAHVAGNDIYADKDFTKEITITNLEKQYISWDQEFSRLKTTDGTKSITLNATSNSGLLVIYELVGDKTGLSLTQSGSVWTLTYSATECKNTTIVAKQGGNATYAPASSVSKVVKVIDPTKVCDTNETLVNSTVTLKSQSTTYNIDIPSTMTIQVSRTKTSWAIYSNGFKVEFYSGRNGTGTRLHEYSYGAGDINTSKTISLSNLNIAAKSVKLISDASNGYNVNSVTYTKQKKCTISPASLSFETYPNTTTSAKTFEVDYANYPISLECSNPKFAFSPAEFGDCDAYGTQTISVTYTAGADEGGDLGYLYIKDNTGTTLKTCTLNVSISKVSQSITSHTIGTAYKTTDRIELSAVANSKLTDFVYSASPEGVASFDGNVMTFAKEGTIAITVTQPGSDVYAATSTTVNNVVVSKVTPDIATNPSGTAVTYLQNLSASTLSGGVADVTLRGVANSKVDGSWAWTNLSTRVEEAAGSHSYEVTFTPTDGGMYNNNTCQVAIQVNKADQTLAMKNGSVKVAVDGIDAGKADSKIDLDDLIESQTADPVAANRAGAVTYEVISENKTTATIAEGNIFSATAIGDYTIRATKAETDYYNAATADFTVTVGKRGNTITTAGPYTKYVDEEVTEVATVVNSDGEIHTSSSDATIAYYDITNNKIVIPNSEAKSFDTKEVTIKIWQDETERFEGIEEADAKTITLTVKKYDNAILVKGVANYVNTITTDSYDNGFVFTANNTDYENSPIIVTQTEGNEIATYYDTAENPKVVYSNSKLGTATWSVTQAESYKYKAAANTFTVKVENAAMGQCFMYNDQNEYEVSTHITSFQGEETDKWYIPDAQNAQELYYEAKKSLLASEQFFIQYSKNGTDWTDLDQPDLSNWGTYQTYGPIDVSNIDFVYLRATAKTWATGTKNIKNIRLTRKPYLSAEGISITKTADNQTLYFGNVGAGKVNVNWSVVDGGDIHIVSDNDKFTIPQDVIPNTECNSGTTPVTILYHPTSTREESATITIYNTNQRVEVTVTGEAGKAPQTIVWYINGEAVDTRTNPKPAVRTTDIITARTNRNHEVTFTSVSNAELMEITANGTLIPLQEGEVTVYAHGAVDEEDRANYAEVNDQLTFVVTEAAIQTIVWDQTFLGMDQNNEDIPLTAYAKWTDENGDEQRREVIYSVADESVAQVVDGKLDIHAQGTTIITATAPGGEENGITFLEAIATKKIVVRDPNADCDRLVYTQSEEKAADCGWNLTHKVDRSIIFDLSEYGEPRTCNFDYTGASHKDLVGVYYFYAGTVKVEQYLSTINQWVEVETSLSSYSKGSKDGAKGTYVNSGDIQLDAHATKIQVSVYGAVGYFYVNNMQITLARYIEPDQETMELGEHSVGEVFKNEVPLEISYSNVAGPITITSSKPDLFYVAEENRMLDVECGAEGMKAVNVYYHPVSDSESDEAVLTISDGKMTKEVTLHASTADLRYIFNSENTTWEQNNNWIGKDAPTSGDYIVEIQTDVVLTTDVSVYSLTIDEGATLTIGDGGTLTIGEGNSIQKETYGNLHVAKGGKVRLTTGKLIVNDFVLDAELADLEHSGRSGQVHNTNQLVINGDAYFDLALDPTRQCSPGWYDFTVPFPVDAVNGVTRFRNSDHQEYSIRNEVNYAIMDFSESRRVETGYGWKKFHSVMQPGQCYTITIDSYDYIYRFKKTTTGSLNLSSTTLMAYSDVENENKGWNCLGNGTLEYANLSAEGIEKVHIYNHATNSYTAVYMDEYTYVVGSAYMIKTTSAGKEITYTHEGGTRTLRAPRRSSSETEFMLSLSQEGANYSDDRLYVSADEEATYYYEDGRELTKFASPTDSKVAQVWANAYGLKLCDVEMPLVDNEARIELSFFAPKAGSYTFAVDRMPEDEADLYLTYNGSDIWNLTESPYTLDLTKGTTEGYGLRIQSRNAPQITTGVDEIDGEKEGNRKVLIGNDIYIITKEGAIFNATGKKVK